VWQVKLCDPRVTHGPYMSALEILHDKALYKFMFPLLTYLLTYLLQPYSATCLFFGEFSLQSPDLLVSMRQQHVSSLDQGQEFTESLPTSARFDVCAGPPTTFT